MNIEWAANAKKDMYLCKMTNRRLSILTGYSAEYISMIFNGKKQSEVAKLKILNAIEEERARLTGN